MVDSYRDLFLHGQQLFLPLQIQTHKPKAKRKQKSDLAQHGRDQRNKGTCETLTAEDGEASAGAAGVAVAGAGGGDASESDIGRAPTRRRRRRPQVGLGFGCVGEERRGVEMERGEGEI
jgi:hypothetical protein